MTLTTVRPSPGNVADGEPKRHKAADVAPRRFRPDIQGLRAVAVLLVVLYHAGVPGLRGGFVGVDVFFVISGFLITGQLAKELERTGRISLLAFYARRARRLLPPAALVVVASLIFAHFFMPFSQLVSLTRDALYTAIYGINYHLAIEGVNYQNASAPPSAFQHFWSLAVEEQFYLVWPLLMIICAVVGRNRLRRVLLIFAIVAVCAVTLKLSIVTTPKDSPMAYFGIQTRAWELGIGALIALMSPAIAGLPDRAARLLGASGLVAVIASAFVYSDQTPYPGSAALVPVLGTAAIIAAGTRAVDRSVESRLLSGGAMQYIGRASYTWYLWHWPMLILIPLWWGRDLVLWERLEVVFLAFWFAVLTYFLENASARSMWRAGRWVMTGLGLSAAMAVTASVVALLIPNLEGAGAAQAAITLSSADQAVVTRALTESLPITKVPSNLTPTIKNAAYDSPSGRGFGCIADLQSVTSPMCVLGDKHGQRTAVLVGDSHADQWVGALSPWAKQYHWKLIEMTKSACPVARLPVWEFDLKRIYTECTTYQKWRDQQIKRIAPDLIIASSADALGISVDHPPNVWSDVTVNELKDLAGGHSRVVYIGDSPYLSPDGLGCIEKNLNEARTCVYHRSLASQPAWNEAYLLLGKKTVGAGFAYIDTRKFFCINNECPLIVKNMLTHRDQGHVTDTYATWLAPMFAPIFKDGKS
ncbi:MAG: putative acyltransferase [Marmoricola sp.]|nr:putative acyltransferase [Marmoricola sp.]